MPRSGVPGNGSKRARTGWRMLHRRVGFAEPLWASPFLSVMDADVAAFRTALRAAGYTPFGGEG